MTPRTLALAAIVLLAGCGAPPAPASPTPAERTVVIEPPTPTPAVHTVVVNRTVERFVIVNRTVTRVRTVTVTVPSPTPKVRVVTVTRTVVRTPTATPTAAPTPTPEPEVGELLSVETEYEFRLKNETRYVDLVGRFTNDHGYAVTIDIHLRTFDRYGEHCTTFLMVEDVTLDGGGSEIYTETMQTDLLDCDDDFVFVPHNPRKGSG